MNLNPPDPREHALKRSATVMGKQDFGLTNLTRRLVMGTNLLHQGEVLGLIALGCP